MSALAILGRLRLRLFVHPLPSSLHLRRLSLPQEYLKNIVGVYMTPLGGVEY